MIDRTTAEALDRDGFVVLRGFLGDADTGELSRLLTAEVRRADSRPSAEFTTRDRGVMYALSDAPRGRAILVKAAQAVRPVLTACHDDPFIEHTKALVKNGNAPATPWHQDAAYWSSYDPEESMITLWVALGPSTPETGCLRFVPGSQQGPILPHVAHEVEGGRIIDPAVAGEMGIDRSAVDLTMAAGDAVLFRSRVVHGAHANRTGGPRLAFKLVFQDAAKRAAGVPLHRTAMGVSGERRSLEPAPDAPAAPGRAEKGSMAASMRSVTRFLRPMWQLMPEPARQAIRPLKRRLTRRGSPPEAQLTDTFANLRRFQLGATEREWKQLCFYSEMIDLIDEVPGDIAEFGVSGGISLLSFVRLLRIKERGLDGKERRHVYGFDSFEGLPQLTAHDRSSQATNKQMKHGGFNDTSGQRELFEYVQGDDHVVLVKGWFDQTLPGFLRDHPHVGFALVHVDCDLYESTKAVLDHVWTHVVPGGVVVFDELYHKDFPGEARAFREFFPGKELVLRHSRIKPDKKYVVKKPTVP